ncbi:MAG: DUF438 domain-containing protein [Vulcanibacillus sp.]
MSEYINNRAQKQKILKELITELHNGKSVDDVKGKFAKLIVGVTTSDISEMEEALIKEGMPVENIQALCDVHAAVFKGSIEEIHRESSPLDIAGHPLNTLDLENKALQDLIDKKVKPDINDYKSNNNEENTNKLIEDFKQLLGIDKHYQIKEYLIFPLLEKYGINAPPQVMWGVDDEIRNGIKNTIKILSNNEEKETSIAGIEEIVNKMIEMIYKEKDILFPLTLDYFTEDEWYKIYQEIDDIGYFLVKQEGKWFPNRVDIAGTKDMRDGIKDGYVNFETGILSFKQLDLILDMLPVEVTFIDKDDTVKYFSHGEERIFTRTKAIIGRTVQNCHPPASIHIVNKMLEDFKSGKKDYEDFWIEMGEMFVYIKYFALRDKENKYIGTIEVTQNIKTLRELKGEKRLMS